MDWSAKNINTLDLQQAILQKRTLTRSLLVLDNIETLIEALGAGEPGAKSLATFISRLKEGDGLILLTSRVTPPDDWGQCVSITLEGLEEQAGADLFQSLLDPEHRRKTTEQARLELTRRVRGHPLAIRLLAGRFNEGVSELTTFLRAIENELQVVEQQTPTSMEDPARHATLYACMHYSIKHLTPDEMHVLHTVSIFQAPFLLEFASYVLEDEDGERTAQSLQRLVRLGLLTRRRQIFADGELDLFELHPMLRWYLHYHQPPLEEKMLHRYGQVYLDLAEGSYQIEGGYDQSPTTRALIQQSLVDCEVALDHLHPQEKSLLARYLAEPYMRRGQYQRAQILLKEALSINEELGDPRDIAITQGDLAGLLVQMGKREEARELYEQVLQVSQELGDPRDIAITQGDLAGLLVDLGKREEAQQLYEQALRIQRELGDPRDIAITQGDLARLLVQMGKRAEARELYEQALRTKHELGDPRSIAITQGALAGLLVQMGKREEAQQLYEQVLRVAQALGDPRWIAITQGDLARLLVQMGKREEAQQLYEQALRTLRELGDPRDIAITQGDLARLLVQMGKRAEAQQLYEQALRTLRELGDPRDIAITQGDLARLLVQMGKREEARELYEQVLPIAQALGDPQWIAITQAGYSWLLFQEGERGGALALLWNAYLLANKSRLPPIIEGTQQDLISMKELVEDEMIFMTLWEENIQESQPEWLLAVQAGSANTPRVLSETEQAVVDFVNTENWDEAQRVIEERQDLLLSAEAEGVLERIILEFQQANNQDLVGHLKAHLDVIRRCKKDGIVTTFRQIKVEQAVVVFVNTENWDEAQAIMEEWQEILLSVEAEVFLEQEIQKYQQENNQSLVEWLASHLTIIRDCKDEGIGPTFELLKASEQQEGESG